MASKKKAAEGIALLSMYNDEDDEEMEDLEEQQQELERRNQSVPEDEQPTENEIEFGEAAMEEDPRPYDTATPSQEDAPLRKTPSVRGKLTIVDYGHDEVVMSPEREGLQDAEAGTGGRVIVAEHRTANGDVLVRSPAGTNQMTPQSSGLELLQPDNVGHAIIGSETVEGEEGINVSEETVDPLDKFLPPPPREKCSDELQRKIDKFLNLKRAGKSFNAEVRNRKDYRNPDFLLHAVRYQDIDQIGSCFSKDVFDPHGYDKSDYYDEIENDMKREREKKDQESKKNQKLDFVSGGSQPGTVTASKISLPIQAVPASGLHSAPASGDNVSREGRQNKKSKWDKVDTDRRNPLPVGGQESLSTVGAHTVILSAANAGAGYAAFAQQRRRETEEKRPTEKKLDRRS